MRRATDVTDPILSGAFFKISSILYQPRYYLFGHLAATRRQANRDEGQRTQHTLEVLPLPTWEEWAHPPYRGGHPKSNPAGNRSHRPSLQGGGVAGLPVRSRPRRTKNATEAQKRVPDPWAEAARGGHRLPLDTGGFEDVCEKSSEASSLGRARGFNSPQEGGG